MTLPVTPRIAGPYNCNGSLVDFDFDFKVFTDADIRVVLTDDDGVETNLTLTTHYAVALNADQQNNPGGTITTVATYAASYTITIDGALTYGQPTELTNLGRFFPKVIEKALDRLGILIQQLKKFADRSLKLPVSLAGVNTEITGFAAGAFLRAKLSGLGLEFVDAVYSLGSFLQSGTGAVSRTADSKLAELWVSVKDFGAVGDDVTNDAAAIQAAIDAVFARSPSGGVVYFPAGTYLTGTTTLNLKRGVTLQGEGKAVSRINYTGTGAGSRAIRFNNVTINDSYYANVGIFDLFIYTATAGCEAVVELNCLGGSYWHVERCRISGSGQYGLICDAMQFGWIRDNIIENGAGVSGSVALWITNGADRTTGQLINYSNLITVEVNNFNVARTGVVDDGGVSHHYRSNNWNGSRVCMRLAALQGGSVLGGTFEGDAVNGTADMIFSDDTAAGTNVGGCLNVSVENMYCGTRPQAGAKIRFTNAFAQYHYGMKVAHCAFSYGSREGTGLAAIDVTTLRNSFCGYNVDFGGGFASTVTHYTGRHVDEFGNTLLMPGGTFADTSINFHDRNDILEAFPGGLAIGTASSTHAIFGVQERDATADQSITSNTTLASLTGFDIVLAANERWKGKATLHVGDGLATTGIKLALNVPVGCTMEFQAAVTPDVPNTGGRYVRHTDTDGAALDFTTANLASCGIATVELSIWVSNGANAGTAQVEIAQSTSSATALVVRKGSHMKADRRA